MHIQFLESLVKYHDGLLWIYMVWRLWQVFGTEAKAQLISLYSQGRTVVKSPEFQISCEYMLDSHWVDMSSRLRQGNRIHLNASSIIRYSYTLASTDMHYHYIRSNPLPIVLTIPLPSKKDSRHRTPLRSLKGTLLNSQGFAAKCKYISVQI